MRTTFGTIEHDEYGTTIRATRAQLYEWSHRPGNFWPCATMRIGGWAAFDARGNLVELSPGWTRADIDGHELSAWADDVRAWEQEVLESCRVGREGTSHV